MKRQYLVAIGAAIFFSGCSTSSSPTADGAFGAGTGVGGSDGGSGSTTVGTASTGEASTGTTSTGQTTASSTTGATGGAGGSALVCDGQKDCGDFGTGCIGCATQGQCATQYNDCANSVSCYTFSACAGQCADDAATCTMKCDGGKPAALAACLSACSDTAAACLNEKCVDANADGAQKYSSLVQCIVCEACPSDCSSLAKDCSP